MQKNPLQKLIEIEKDARKFGFEWSNVDMILAQVVSESAEIKDAISQCESTDRIQEEIGDLLHTAISLCRFLELDIDNTLDKACKKFSTRMEALKKAAKAKGLDSLHGQSEGFMLALWQEAKSKDV